MSSAKECFLAHNTLACVIKLALGHVTTVELKNDAFVTGLVNQVDGFMNVTLEDAVMTDASGRSRRFEHFFVPNRVIRFVQIPPSIDIRQGLESEFNKNVRKGKKEESKVDRGRKKILEKRQARQREDLANAIRMAREKSDSDNKGKEGNENNQGEQAL